jgi:hypothetical protein
LFPFLNRFVLLDRREWQLLPKILKKFGTAISDANTMGAGHGVARIRVSGVRGRVSNGERASGQPGGKGICFGWKLTRIEARP